MTHISRLSSQARRAFTLVELLVVIGIIALLISILLPSLARARQSAQTVACQSNLRQIGYALQLYQLDNNGLLPLGWMDNTPGKSDSTEWTILLANTLGKSAISYSTQTAAGEDGSGMRRIFYCPAVPTPPVVWNVTHYSAHPRLMPNISSWDPLRNSKPRCVKGAAIKRSAEIGVVFDGSLWDFSGGSGDWLASACVDGLDAWRWWYDTYLTDDYTIGNVPTEWYMTPQNSIDISSSDVNQDTQGNWQNVRFRHNGDKVCNVLYMDGHCEPHSWTDKYNTTILRGNINVNLTQ